MKKIIALLLALVMVFALVACGNKTPSEPSTPSTPSTPSEPSTPGEPSAPADPFADMDEIEMIFTSTRNEKADAAQIEWMNKLTEATGGKLQFDIYLSNSLISNTRDIPDAIVSGIADLALLNINNYPGMFPLNHNIISIPFTGVTEDCRLDIMEYMYDKYPALEEEFTQNGMHLIGWYLTNFNNMGVKLGKEYTSIADIKNVKITGSSDTEMEILAAAGAVPVTVAFPEIYQSLEKNVVNGFINHSAPAFSMNFHEHIDNWIVFGEGSGLCTTLVAVVTSLEKWNSLPPAVQALFEEFEPERAVNEVNVQRGFDAMLKTTMEAAGKHYVVLDEAQLAEWEPFVQPSVERILSEMEASHPGFGAMYEDLCNYIANYGK